MYDMVESIFLVYFKVRYDFYFFKTCHILVQSHCWPLYTFEEKVTKHYKFHLIDIKIDMKDNLKSTWYPGIKLRY